MTDNEAGPRLKALIVDDERSIAEVVRLVLTGAGFETFVTLESSEICSMIPEVCPDVVITDYRMPKMSGMDLIDHIRKNHQSLPVVLMTAQASFQMPVEIDSNLYKIVQKPFRNDDLINTVRAAIVGASGRKLLQ